MIREKIQELQKLIEDRYGVKADVVVNLFTTDNPALTRELANYISFDIASRYRDRDIYSYVCEQKDDTHWVGFCILDEKFTFAAFYDAPYVAPANLASKEEEIA